MALDFNIEPFFDDYSEDDKFYRILFRPGYAVQARELTQMQTILQQQIKRHGDHIFKNGSMVIPGQISYDTNTPYVKLKAVTSSSATVSTYSVLSQVVGKTYRGATSGVQATVLTSTPREVINSVVEADTIYVKYTSGNGKFQTGEIIAPIDGSSGLDLTVEDLATDANTLGIASTASIQRGIYYIKDNFVLVTAQTTVLSKYSSTPSVKAGLKVVEDIKYPEDDGYDILLDNALGSPNYAAPGAARYYIDLVLSYVSYDLVTDPYTFIPLLTLKNGNVEFLLDKTEYAQLEKTLARRTYDESGDYTVRPFPIQLKEYRNNYRGAWANSKTYIVGDIVTTNSITYKCTLNHTSHASNAFSDANWIEDSTPNYNYGLNLGVTNTIDITNDILPDTKKISLSIEPGKAYVKGYEVEKVATSYLTIDKARTISSINSAPIDTSPGNYVLVNSVNSLPDIATIVSFYDRYGNAGQISAGTEVATARVKQIQLDSSGVYKIFLFDIATVSGYNFARDAKFLYSVTGGSAALRFSARIVPTAIELVGTLTASTTSSSVGGVNTTFTSDFKVGDYAIINENSYRVITVTNSAITIDTAITIVAGTKIYRSQSTIQEPNKTSGLYTIPVFATQSTQNFRYTFYRKETNLAYNAVITASGYVFASNEDSKNYIVVDRTTGTHLTLVSGTPSAGQFRVVINGSQATFTMPPDATYDIIYAIRKSVDGSIPATKVLRTITETSLTLVGGKVTLTKPDGFELVSVINSSNVNITSSFVFNNGQTANYYDLSSISSTSVLTGVVTVKYSYFDLTTAGDYASVDSYTGTSSNITYEELASTIAINTIDFRPTKNANGTWTGSVIPKYGIDTDIEYYYYLGRIDKLAIDSTGQFIITKGIPGAIALAPTSPNNSMDLYTMYIEPYTFTASNGIRTERVENKRYTMRDIGKLETRIKNLEYYTSLSLVEQNTINLKSYDKNGLERPQNGFLVDSFNGQGIGDVSSNDWKASIDSVNQELRPFYTVSNISLFEEVGSTLNRSAKNYIVSGDLVTLPIASTTPLVKQLRASQTESVNPFDVYAFAGTLELNPWSDTWFETGRRPDVIVNNNGQYDAVVAKAEAAGVLGTVWGASTTLWFGDTSTTALSNTSTDTIVNNIRTTTQTLVFATATTGVTAGVKTFIVPNTVDTTISDKVVSTELIPYMRSRNILFRGEGFKPQTTMYAFFDSLDVNTYIRPAKRIEVIGYGSTSTPPSYVLNTNIGTNSNSSSRKVNGLVDTSYSYGEVLNEYQSISGAAGTLTGVTCILLGQEVVNGKYIYYIDNILGGALHADSGSTVYYLQGEFTAGTIKYVSASTYNQLSPTTLTSTYTGQLFGTFTIPNNSSISFRTGVRQLRFTDSSTNAISTELTYSEKSFESRGTLEWKEKTILSTKTAEVASEKVSQNFTIAGTRTSVTSSSVALNNNNDGWGGGWEDPLAQTFMVDVPGGVFVTDLDLFFAAKDPVISIKVEIRNVVNGYPGSIVVPYSTVIKYPSSVNIHEKGATATNFKFKSPVYLQSGTEYCICIFADSAKYKIWVAQSGAFDISGNGLISGQPYMGVLFKSQNASTWTADQSQDLKFQLNRAVFAINQTATLNLVNQNVSANAYFDVLQINANNIVFSNTSITSKYLDTPGTGATNMDIELNKNIIFDSPKLIKSVANESSIPSLRVILTMSSAASNLSPVIDLSRCSATMTSNVIEASISGSIVATVACSGTAGQFTCGASTLAVADRVIITGVNTGTATSVTAGTYKVSSISGTSPSVTGFTLTTEAGGALTTVAGTLVGLTYITDTETIPSIGTATAKYATKQINLSNNATTLRIIYDAHVPNITNANIDVYYKVGNSASASFETQPYVLATATSPYSKTQNYSKFSEAEYLVEDIAPFNCIKAKLVFKSDNTSQVPRVKNLRVLAYA